MKKRILFVDDEPNFLDGIRLMLRHQRDEWDLAFAGSVNEAIGQVTQGSFDAIVSDVSMPVRTGLDLLETLQASDDTREIPVVILTGNAQTDLKRRALNLGATDLLNKPVTPEDLLARLRSVLRLKSFQDALKLQNQTLEQRVKERTRDLECSRRDILWRLAKAGEYRDEETGDHVVRVACFSRVIAEGLGLDDAQVETVFLTSPLHDIGKIGVPDGILLKADKLSATERLIMERHCEIGASILLEEPKGKHALCDSEAAMRPSRESSPTEPLREMAARIAMNHHEKWDGTAVRERP